MCFFREKALVNDFWHSWQLNGFSPIGVFGFAIRLLTHLIGSLTIYLQYGFPNNLPVNPTEGLASEIIDICYVLLQRFECGFPKEDWSLYSYLKVKGLK